MKVFQDLSHRGQVGRLRQLAAEALGAYDVQPVRVAPVRRGDNAAFRVETSDGQRYVLRIHRVRGTPWHPVRSSAEVGSELAWLAALRRDTDLVVPEPRICVLSRWVEGRFLNASLTPRHLARAGAFMARLHLHALAFERPEGFTRGWVGDTSPEVAAYVLDTVSEFGGRDAAAIAEEVIGRARAAQEALGKTRETFGLIHGDLHQENYLFHRGEVRAIDFDDCGWGHCLWDFAVTLSEVSYFLEYDALRSALLRGYQAVRPLPEGIETHLEPLMALRLLQLNLWFLEMRDDPAFSDWADEVQGILAELRENVST
ncbi:MAG: phosphotransferase enzyme family protein [Thermomicrobiales bacterium]